MTKYNLRDNLTFDLTHSYWKGLSDSFTHRAYIIWNALPVNIKSSPSLASFKEILQNTLHLLVEYLLGPVPLLHTRTLMTLFTFRLPFLQIILMIYHAAFFCILVAVLI